ncbi:MAG: GtrA family protein [Sphingopyxis sp.]|nr:GtrA family protein [Sphingopyxis sp.]
MLSSLLHQLWTLIFFRYVGASVVALVADVGLFLLLLSAGLLAPAASAIGFCLGIAVHWLMSSRVVFVTTTARGGTERWRQKFLFLLSAGVGLTLTVAIVSYGAVVGMDPRAAKGIAIIISFTTTYLLRRLFVFAVR